jgi:hypothetical protein
VSRSAGILPALGERLTVITRPNRDWASIVKRARKAGHRPALRPVRGGAKREWKRERARPGRCFPRPRGKTRTHQNNPGVRSSFTRKRLAARRGQRRPGRACSPTSEIRAEPGSQNGNRQTVCGSDVAPAFQPAGWAGAGHASLDFRSQIANSRPGGKRGWATTKHTK